MQRAVMVVMASLYMLALIGCTPTERVNGQRPIAASPAAPAVPPMETITGDYVVTQHVILRTQPSVSAPSVRALLPGQRLQVRGKVKDRDWYAVTGLAPGFVPGEALVPLTALDPQAAEALFFLAFEAAKQRHIAATIPFFEEGLRLDPGHVLGRLYLGRAYRSVDQLDAAAEQYQQVIAMAPQSPEAAQAQPELAQVEAILALRQARARTLRRQQDREVIQQLLSLMVDMHAVFVRHGDDTAILEWLARTYAEVGDMTTALRLARQHQARLFDRKLYWTHPTLYVELIPIFQSWSHSQAVQDAITAHMNDLTIYTQQYTKLSSVRRSIFAEKLISIVYKLKTAGFESEARKTFMTAMYIYQDIDSYYRLPDAMRNHALLYAEFGDFTSAFSIAQSLQEKDNYYYDTLGGIAWLQYKSGDQQGALETIKRAEERARKDKYLRIFFLSRLMITQYKIGNTKTFEKYLTKIHEKMNESIDKPNKKDISRIFIMYEKIGKNKEAITSLQQFVDYCNKNGQKDCLPDDVISSLYMLLEGEKTGNILSLMHAIRLNLPNDISSATDTPNLLDLQYRVGDKEGARSALLRAVGDRCYGMQTYARIGEVQEILTEATARHKAGDATGARQVVARALEVAKTVHPACLRFVALSQIVGTLADFSRESLPGRTS